MQITKAGATPSARGPAEYFTGCERAGTLDNNLDLESEEQGAPVWVCDGPVGSWSTRWDDLVHYDA